MPISRDDLPIFLLGFAHVYDLPIFLVRLAHFLSKICFGGRFRVTVMTNPVLSENDEKLILHPQRRLSNRFSETVKTNPVLSQDDAERILHQKTSFY